MNKIWIPKIEIPAVLAADERLSAARTALETLLAALSTDARQALFLPRLNLLTGAILDILANQYHVDFYDPNMTDEIKRRLIRDAIGWHRRKGTPSAVEEIARTMFNTAYVEEWFEYGGAPYFFRLVQDISSDDEDSDRGTINRLKAAVEESKNTRSWLEIIIFDIAHHDTIEPVDLTPQLDLALDSHDWYDYRRQVETFNGDLDFGSTELTFNGRISFGGGHRFQSYQSRARYGQLQASDFEVLEFELEHRAEETIEPTEDHAFDIELATVHDTVEPTDTFSDLELAAEYHDTVGETDIWGTLEIDFKAPIEPVDASTYLHAGIYQSIAFNGHYSANGDVSFNGNLYVEGDLKNADDEQWDALRAQLSTTFATPCPSCGSTHYTFKKSSVRIGTARFRITDPQTLTLLIDCADCGVNIATFLIGGSS